MKMYISFGKVFLLGLLALAACQEVGPPVNMGLTSNSLSDTSYVDANASTPEERKVLLEEFTGVRCVNCPRAHNTIKTLQDQNPGLVVAVGIHTANTQFGQPFTNRQDLRVPENGSLENLLGGAQGYPSGAVNRKKFSGESQLLISDQKWSNYVSAELVGTTPLNIGINHDFDPASRDLWIEAEVKFNSTMEGPLNLTVYLTEDYIYEHQLTTTGIDTEYVHKHVLRQVITPYNGEGLSTTTFEANRVVKHRYLIKLPELWDVSSCNLVAFVHRIGEVPEVIQAVEKVIQ